MSVALQVYYNHVWPREQCSDHPAAASVVSLASAIWAMLQVDIS